MGQDAHTLSRGSAMLETDAIKKIHRIKVLTIGELSDMLASSVITARRYLKRWEAITSFNHNGRYYTLPGIPRFDHHGIWRHQTIHFSKYGTLKQTIIHLVTRSESGLSAREIAQIVGLPSNSSIFSRLQDISGIRRQKHQGRFVYFSDEHQRYQEQKSVLYRPETVGRLPSDEEAVLILVQVIKHPHIGIEGISEKLAQQGTIIAPSVIRSFLAHHDLLKKIPDTGQ
jgi:hypothetical protein